MEILHKFDEQDIQHLSTTNLKLKQTVATLLADNHELKSKLKIAVKTLKEVSMTISKKIKS